MRRIDGRMAIAVRRILGLIVLGGVLAATAGCSADLMVPSLDNKVKDSLAVMVESAQEDLWPFRQSLAADPEAVLPDLPFVSDARPGHADPASELPSGLALLDVDLSREGAVLTFAISTRVASGGGWFYESKRGMVCFGLQFPAAEPVIRTLSAECSDDEGNQLGEIEHFVDTYGEPIPLDELDVRLTATEADFPQPPCQCYSGSECECPGG